MARNRSLLLYGLIAALVLAACGLTFWAWRDQAAQTRSDTEPVSAPRAEVGELPCGSWVDVGVPITNLTDRPLAILDVSYV